jgi:hypothetical protein
LDTALFQKRVGKAVVIRHAQHLEQSWGTKVSLDQTHYPASVRSQSRCGRSSNLAAPVAVIDGSEHHHPWLLLLRLQKHLLHQILRQVAGQLARKRPAERLPWNKRRPYVAAGRKNLEPFHLPH